MAVRTHAHGGAPSPHAPPVPGFLVQAVLQLAQDEGVPLPHARMMAGGRSPAFGEPADFCMPGPEFQRLLRAVAAAASPRAAGLAIGARISEPNLHVFGPVITASRTMRDAFSHCAALCQMMRYTLNGRLEVRDEQVHYVMGETAFGPIWEDIVIALSYHAAHRFLASAPSQADRHVGAFTAHFARPTPTNLDEYLHCFGGHVRFEADMTALAFPLSLLDLPRPGTDATLAAEVREVSARRLQPLDPTNSWSGRVESALRGLGDLSQVDLQRLSARWGVSTRTLRRRLAAEGTSLVRVLEGVRFERALYYLQQTDASIAKVAEILGYSEPTSFRRAFKRWSGSSPNEHRAKPTQPAQPAQLSPPPKAQGA